MKKKILIALIVVLALSVSVLAGCNLSIMSIELKSGTLATQYYVGETVDLSNAKITVAKSDGTTEDVALTSSMLDKEISTAEAGKTTYTVTYKEKTCTIEITVINPTIALKAGSFATEYFVGDQVSYDNAKLTVTEGEKTRDVDLTAAMVSPAIDTAKAGKTTHTISYNGAETSVEITVNAPTIALVEGSLKLEYLVDEAVSLEGAKIAVTKGNRPVQNVDLTQSMLNAAISTAQVGKTTYTITYQGATTTFEVTVRQVKSIDGITGLSVNPIVGQSITLDNAKISVTYTGEPAETAQIALTWSMIKKVVGEQDQDVTSIDTSEVGEQQFAVVYGGQRYEFTVTVRDVPVQSISVSNKFNTKYYVGYDAPVITGEYLVVELEGGETQTMALNTAAFQPAFDATKTQTYTLTYRGKETTLTINVYDIELQLADGFKKAYNVGDEIFADGKLVSSQIKVVAADGTTVETVDVTQAMVTETFSTDTQGGGRSLTIEYKGKSLVVDDIVVNPITIEVQTTGDGAFATKLVKDSTVSYAGKLVITYTNKTTKTIDIAQSMFTTAISTAALGETDYVVRYKDAETTVTIKVVPAEADKVAFTAWNTPAFIRNYETKSADINNSPLTESSKYRKFDVYEVGSANKFLFVPVAFNNGPSVTSTIWTNVSFAVKGADNNYTELTGDALKEFVTIENNAYLFREPAYGKTVKMTVTADSDYHIVSENVKPLTWEFVVVENGYNVYNQDGLAVMTDLLKPEFWADIIGYAVDGNGNYCDLPDPSKAMRLPADNEPLWKYIGNVDWVIIHGDIEIDPDKLPDGYFWNGNEGAHWEAANTALDQTSYKDARKEMLKGSLREFSAKGDTGLSYDDYITCKYNTDDNNNKAFYATNRANVSGNFSAITLHQGRSEGGRILESVVYRHTAESDRKDEIYSQWHLFKMFVEKTYCSEHSVWDYHNSPEKEFTLKNISLKGTTSLSGTTATDSDGNGKGNISSGPAMINFTCTKMYLTNVLAQGFNVNVSADNYLETVAVDIDSCQITDSFSSAIFTWRGTVDVKNSYMANFGGPVFIVGDGNRRAGNNDVAPSITLDKNSYAESYALGTEPWYTALNTMVRQLFTTLQALNEQAFKTATGKSYTKTDDKGSNRINVIAIMIPETGQVFEDQGDDPIVIKGSYTHNKENATIVASMEDPQFKELADQNKPMIFNSGSCYAYLEMSITGTDDKGNPIVDQTVKTIEQDGYPNWASWAQGGTSDTMTVWINIKSLLNAGQASSPYIGVVIGNFEKVAAQG